MLPQGLCEPFVLQFRGQWGNSGAKFKEVL